VHLICPDHRGFGSSAKANTTPSMESMALDVVQLMDALKLPRAIIGGVSMGGYIAMALLRLKPERVKGLVLLNTHPYADDAAGQHRRETTAQDLEKNGMALLVATMLPQMLSANAKPYDRARIEQIMRGVNPSAAAAATRAMGQRADSCTLLQNYTGPTLIVGGEDDAIVSLERTRAFAALSPKATVKILPNLGHLANIEAPGRVSEELERFVKSVV
jgi:pimeloyl-ACP methyl ester carboxylesterase